MAVFTVHGSLTSICWMMVLFIFAVEGKMKVPCSVCKEITKNFHKGLVTTSKSNYGGGNTKWEEKSLGSYATSEVRLVEIVEKLCEGASKECHSVLEEHEELIERFWFKEFAQRKDTDFFEYVCIDHMKGCCYNNTFGPDCSPCPGEVDRPCSGNGRCIGEGTREGSGKCKCSSGYKGDICNVCKDGYFEESKNETHTVCKVCHISCKGTCWEEGPKGCDECKSGWNSDEELGCQDINECLENPCEAKQFCTNTQGSFTCFSCDPACTSCTGSGPSKCNECNTGYDRNAETGHCDDINECEQDSNLCPGEHQECLNVPGNHECVCVTGYRWVDGACQPIPKESVKTQKLEPPPNLVEELKKSMSKNKKGLDWSKFKDIPSVSAHFLVMALYGISCRFAASNWLAVSTLSLLMVIHVVWFATTSH